jgi:bifunctional non-homologous end joining protein LigD
MRATRDVSNRWLREGSAGVAALHLGQHEGDEVRYIGKVGTGFTCKSSIEIRRKLDAITTAKSPLRKPVRTLKLCGSSQNMWRRTWNTDVAAEGHLRHSSFKGLREDR